MTKWSFLLAQRQSTQTDPSLYQFLPYRFGPYSFTLYHETNALIRGGLVKEEGKNWALSPAGWSYEYAIPRATESAILSIVNTYGNMPGSRLTDEIYGEFPWFTINSNDKTRRAFQRPLATPAIYTLGYERLMVDGFLNIVLREGIQRVLDVRNNPVSRRYGFHKSTLQRLCRYLAIEYVHLPQLGIPSDDRRELESDSDYRTVFEAYEDRLAQGKEAVAKTTQLMWEKPSVLVCMEADPRYCHRSRLAARIASAADLPVVHLGWPR